VLSGLVQARDIDVSVTFAEVTFAAKSLFLFGFSISFLLSFF